MERRVWFNAGKHCKALVPQGFRAALRASCPTQRLVQPYSMQSIQPLPDHLGSLVPHLPTRRCAQDHDALTMWITWEAWCHPYRHAIARDASFPYRLWPMSRTNTSVRSRTVS